MYELEKYPVNTKHLATILEIKITQLNENFVQLKDKEGTTMIREKCDWE